MTTHSIQNIAPNNPAFPATLLHISQPPKMLYIQSKNWHDLLARPKVAVVGSRRATAYGKQVTAQLAGELARAGVVIVSGLAIGIDSIAHRAALDSGGLTIAVLPSGLDTIYPASHYQLAQSIIEQGGALIKAGASLVTCSADILQMLGIQPLRTTAKPVADTPQEQILIDLIYSGTQDGALLLSQSRLTVTQYNQSLTMLEIQGTVRALGNNQWGLSS